MLSQAYKSNLARSVQEYYFPHIRLVNIEQQSLMLVSNAIYGRVAVSQKFRQFSILNSAAVQNNETREFHLHFKI